jgi:hypothetical protein
MADIGRPRRVIEVPDRESVRPFAEPRPEPAAPAEPVPTTPGR